MIGAFSKYILVAILFAAIIITVIIFITCKHKKKSFVAKKDLDDNRTLDLDECFHTEENNMPELSDDLFEVEYELTFIHTNEIII